MRWAVEITCEEARAHLGFETPRQWSAKAIAPTPPVLLGRFSLVTLLALQLSQRDPLPVSATAWDRKVEPTFTAGLALGRQHLWRVRYGVNSTPEAESMPCPPEVFDLLIHGLPLAA
jgi:hypothetical protein